jgi:hypothetical protein
MRPHWLFRGTVLLLLASLLGCGADGGVGGTGISAISGNVTLGPIAAIEDPNDLEGIVVGIGGTTVNTETDRLGRFDLVGEFDGNVTVEFTERNGTVNRMAVDVPSGGELQLRNVRLSQGEARAERVEVDFEAAVTAPAVCDGPQGSLEVSDKDARNFFGVLVDAATRYESSRGCPEEPSCEDLLATRTLRLLGTQRGGIVEAQRIRLIRCRPPGTGR